MKAMTSRTLLVLLSIAIGALVSLEITSSQNAPDLKRLFEKMDVRLSIRPTSSCRL
jgi:hypothetical protein